MNVFYSCITWNLIWIRHLSNQAMHHICYHIAFYLCFLFLIKSLNKFGVHYHLQLYLVRVADSWRDYIYSLSTLYGTNSPFAIESVTSVLNWLYLRLKKYYYILSNLKFFYRFLAIFNITFL